MTAHSSRNIALALLLFASFAVAMAAQDTGGTGTLSGMVLNSQGKPVVGASVTMQTADGGSPHATVTNSQGRFFFAELTHGYYDVRAARKRFVSEWKHNVEVSVGKQTDVKLLLAPAHKTE